VERFPPATIPSYIFLYYTIKLYIQNTPIDTSSASMLSIFQLTDIINILCFIGFFLIIRILDEHKDYQHDLIHYPDRILQQGLVSLKQLKILGGIIGLGIFSVHIMQYKELQLLTSLALLSGWLFLMRVDFFMPQKLKKYILLYAFSHMFIFFFVIWWVVQLINPEIHYSLSIFYLQAFAFCGGYAGEILRKFRAPEDKHNYFDAYNHSYSDATLLGWTEISLIGMTLAALGLVCATPSSAIESKHFIYVLVGTIALFIFGMIQYLAKPSVKRQKYLLGLTMLGMLTIYTVLWVNAF
jgi:hypothetical protein